MVDNDINLSIAIDILDRKIAEINTKLVVSPEDKELKNTLKDTINLKDEVCKGNLDLVNKIINDTK